MPRPADPTPTTLQDRIEALSRGQLHVLPTNAAARSLRHAYDRAQRAAGLQTWQPAPVLSWSQFLDRLWSEAVTTGLETRLLVNAAQETALWIDVIQTQPDALASPDALANLAAEAWSLAHTYNVADRLRSTANTHDARTFAQWAEAFQRECDRNRYLTRAELESALSHHISTTQLTAEPFTLVGFQDFNPSQSNLLQAIAKIGIKFITQSLHPTLSSTAARAIFTSSSESDELRQIALHLRSFLQSNPESRSLAVLLTDPADAPALDSVFREILTPELQPIGADTSSKPWEFLSGQPLATVPLITVALDLARWATSPLELPRITALLLSPYLGSPADLDGNALFDANILRQTHLLHPELDLRSLVSLAADNPAPPWLLPLHQHLAKSNLDANRSFADWAEFVRALLTAAQWPGQRSPTSLEFHATQAWDSLLDQLSTLDFRGRRIPYAEFLKALTRQATTAAFTPPSTNAPIQILPPAAAVGQVFDLLILPRATDANYPPAQQPNPLLSWHLQSSLNMPGTTDPAPLDLTCATNLLITYTQETPNGTQRLSPTLAALNLPHLDPIAEPATPPIPEDVFEDTTPLPPLASNVVHGGAGVLQLQAACGFRAFAQIRLSSTTPDNLDLGLDALESGNLLHRALNNFWHRVQSQSELLKLSPEDRDSILAESIEGAVDHRTQVASNWDRAYLSLQLERLHKLLKQWLQQELQRTDFTVDQSEEDKLIQVGPLTLKLRVDRIDQVDGGVFIVDYKTGFTGNPKDWLGPRPDEPQLPLYALLDQPQPLKGLAFAKVRAGKNMKWLGLQSEEHLIPAREVTDLDPLLDEWRTTLTALAEDFAAGLATVSPKDYPTTCAHCGQRILCRLDATTLLALSDENEQAADPSEPEALDV